MLDKLCQKMQNQHSSTQRNLGNQYTKVLKKELYKKKQQIKLKKLEQLLEVLDSHFLEKFKI